MNANQTIDEQIISILTTTDKDKLTLNHIHQLMDKNFPKTLITKVIDDLVWDGRINKDNKNQYFMAKRKHKKDNNFGTIVTGTVDMTANGSAYIVTDEFEKDIYVPHTHTNTAFEGDTVKVKLRKGKFKSKPDGEIIEIVERKQTKFVGELELTDAFGFVVPDNPKVRVHFFVNLKDINNAKNGEKVIVELDEWKAGKKSPNGKIIAILGKPGENETEMVSILAGHGFNTTFPKKVLKYVENISFDIPQSEIDRRVDFRDVTTFTIDPADAKDFDDAISFQFLDNGNYEIGVHIADVTHYCKPGSALDKEAVYRATSVYLVDRVSPMLPEKLSNGVCSLRPNEDKLVFSAVFEMDKNANVINHQFSRSVIHSDRRFSYEQAQEVIETGEGDFPEELKILNNLAHKLRDKRVEHGSIRFEKQEVRFILDEKGKPIDVYEKIRKDAHMMIEDYMLLANKYVAKFFTDYSKNRIEVPAVYRIHAAPNEEKIAQFATMASRFGYKGKFNSPKAISNSLNKILQKIKGKPEQNMLETLAIRSMAKAEYTTKNIGHYGLGFEDYTHFTSPIRRYPDVMVHRTLQQLLDKKPVFKTDEMESLCKHCSQQERSAMEAERESVKYKQVEYLSDKIGEEFDGVISGVQDFGIFVELERSKCEGLIRKEHLNDDKYYYDDDQVAMIGFTKGKKYSLGDKIKVLVAAANLESRKIDFELVEEK